MEHSMEDEEKRMPLFASELRFLTESLHVQLGEPVMCTMEDDGLIARIHTVDTTIACLSVFPKGITQYIVIRLDEYNRDYKIWFQLAFLGCKVSFGKPAVDLPNHWIKKSQE